MENMHFYTSIKTIGVTNDIKKILLRINKTIFFCKFFYLFITIICVTFVEEMFVKNKETTCFSNFFIMTIRVTSVKKIFKKKELYTFSAFLYASHDY